MKKIIRLTESDLARIVRRVISEQSVTNAVKGAINTIPKDEKKEPQKCSDLDGKYGDEWAFHVKAYKNEYKSRSGDKKDPYSYVQLNNGTYCVNKNDANFVTVTDPKMIEIVKKQLIGYER